MSQAMSPGTVDVVLPVLDEAEAIGWVLSRLPVGYRAIIVDNGSVDASADIAREHGALVVAEELRGFGAACYRGLAAAEAEIVCFMDCDGSLDPRDLPVVADPVLAGSADLMLGARQAERGALSPHVRLANRYLAWRIGHLCSVRVTDLGPMRAARRRALLDLAIADRRSGWPLEMVLRASRAGWRIDEQPVPYYARTGRSKVTGTVRGTARAVQDMSAALAEARRAARQEVAS